MQAAYELSWNSLALKVSSSLLGTPREFAALFLSISEYNLSMFLFHKPTAAEINNFLRRQGPSTFSYFGPGSSVHGKAPAGYTVDHSRVQLGSGEVFWEKATAAIRAWEMFNVGWIQLCWP